MNYVNVLIGVAGLTISILVLVLRIQKKENSLGKLKAMKERFGDVAGSRIHFITYVVVPFIVGVLMLSTEALRYFGANG